MIQNTHTFLFGAYSITDYIRFMRVRDEEHAKEKINAKREGYHVR